MSDLKGEITMVAIPTVTGSVDSADLGRVLAHEHVFVLGEEYRQNYQDDWDEDEKVAEAVAELGALPSLGIDTILDPTVIGLGRYLPRVQRVAEQIDLNIVVRDIEDEANNTTRFLVLGREDTAPSGYDKTSLVLTAHHRPSALLELLVPLAKNTINILKLESRPARNSTWEYVFHIDIDGHCNDANIQQALQEILELGVSVKILGAYPVAV